MHILGRVTDATSGAPVGEARVVLEVGGRAVSVNSDDEGRFTWRDDSSGHGRSLEYRAEKPGFEPESGSCVVGDDPFELRIDLQPRRIIVTPERTDVALSPAGRTEPGDPFEAVRAHADYSSLMDLRPSSAGLYVNPVASVIAGVLFVGFGVIWIAFTSNGPWPSGLAAVGLLIVAIGVAVAIHGFVRIGRLLSAPVRTSPARIVGKRTEVWGGGTDTSASTTYFLTLELEGGARRELSTGGRVYGLVAEGDVGVAFTRGVSVLDFRRLDV
jgi:hypothetical protein